MFPFILFDLRGDEKAGETTICNVVDWKLNKVDIGLRMVPKLTVM
jgi:hypothetical protein